MKFSKNLIFIFFVCLFSCNTDNDLSSSVDNDDDPEISIDLPNEDSQAFIANFGNTISRNFLGKVIDSNNNPIQGVTITIGSHIASTDINGVFIISNATIKERFAYIKADKAGYIHGSRAVVPASGTNKVTIMLLEETVVGSTTSGTSETLSLPNGASVALEGNYIKEDGTEYTGNVTVIMHHLDPTDEDMENQMPGMLFAANADNEERMLQSLGMLAVELRGDNGEDLNLAETSTAEINIPVDPSLIDIAPSTIPLWYFDELYGYWKEQGQAILIGNAYVGTVSHFSYWNLDDQFPAVQLCITVVDEDGNQLANQYTTLTHFNSDYLYPTSGGYTNDNGEVCGLVPQGETLEFNLYNYATCQSNAIHTETIGPFTEDSSITITITNTTDIITETVIGTFNNCDGNPIANGYVILNYQGLQFYDFVENGDFEINLIGCEGDTSFAIEAFDYDNFQTTGLINFSFISPLTNLGTINSCNTISEFFYYSIDNGNETEIYFNDFETAFYEEASTYGGAQLVIFVNELDEYHSLFGVLNEAPYIGEYDNWYPNGGTDFGFEFTYSNNTSPLNNNIIFNLTSIGEVGEYIDLNFSGDFEDLEGNPHSVNGTLHVLRDY